MLVFIANIVHGRAGKQYSLGINISFLQSRKQPRSKKVKEGLNRKLFTRLSPFNAKWQVFTSVNSFQFSPAIYCFFQMVYNRQMDAVRGTLLLITEATFSLMRATCCCCNSMKFEALTMS